MKVKVHVHATLPSDLVQWMDGKIKERKYDNRSHALELALMELKRKETVKL